MTCNALARCLARCPPSPANEPPFGSVTHELVWAKPSDALSALVVLGGQECGCWRSVMKKKIVFFWRGRTWSPGLDRWESTTSHLQVSCCTGGEFCCASFQNTALFIEAPSTQVTVFWNVFIEWQHFHSLSGWFDHKKKLKKTPFFACQAALHTLAWHTAHAGIPLLHASHDWRRRSLSRWWLCPSQHSFDTSAECWKSIMMP